MDPQAKNDVTRKDVDAQENSVCPISRFEMHRIAAHANGSKIRDQEKRENGVYEKLKNLEDEDDPESRFDHPRTNRHKRKDDD